MKPDDTIQPDAHLRAALRHAPDADDAAPADISAQIIAAAHRSAGERPALPARPPAVPRRWWLQPWGASGALATVLMAGVIGLMWRGEAPGPAPEDAVPQVAQAPTPIPALTPAPATADAQTNSPAPAPIPQPAATKPRVLAATPAVKPPAKPALESMAAEPSETVASARDAGAAVAAAPPAPAALAAPATPPPSPPPPAPAAANLRAAQRAAQEQSAAAPPNAAAPPALARLRAPAGSAPQAPWRTAPLPGDHFGWQPEGRLLPPDASWLARLSEQSAGRWQPLSVTPATAEVAQLHWQRSGATVARLGFDRDSVWWCGSVAPCERAALDAATLRELLAQLAR